MGFGLKIEFSSEGAKEKEASALQESVFHSKNAFLVTSNLDPVSQKRTMAVCALFYKHALQSNRNCSSPAARDY